MKAIQAMGQAFMGAATICRAYRHVITAEQTREYMKGNLGAVLGVDILEGGTILRLQCSNGVIVLGLDKKFGAAAIKALEELECNLPADERISMDRMHAAEGDQDSINAAGRARLIRTGGRG